MTEFSEAQCPVGQQCVWQRTPPMITCWTGGIPDHVDRRTQSERLQQRIFQVARQQNIWDSEREEIRHHSQVNSIPHAKISNHLLMIQNLMLRKFASQVGYHLT